MHVAHRRRATKERGLSPAQCSFLGFMLRDDQSISSLYSAQEPSVLASSTRARVRRGRLSDLPPTKRPRLSPRARASCVRASTAHAHRRRDHARRERRPAEARKRRDRGRGVPDRALPRRADERARRDRRAHRDRRAARHRARDRHHGRDGRPPAAPRGPRSATGSVRFGVLVWGSRACPAVARSTAGLSISATRAAAREIWSALDDVLLLAPGGRTVFIGQQAEVAPYFAAPPLGWVPAPIDNPADFFMDQVRDAAVEKQPTTHDVARKEI